MSIRYQFLPKFGLKHKYRAAGLGIFVTTPTTTQHNLNTVVGLDMKMTVQTPPHHPPQKLNGEHQGPQINIYWPQLNTIWPITSQIWQVTISSFAKKQKVYSDFFLIFKAWTKLQIQRFPVYWWYCWFVQEWAIIVELGLWVISN